MTTEFNPQKKLDIKNPPCYKVNLDWIKLELIKLYQGNFEDNITRELIVIPIKNNYELIGSYVFSLNGSPPKGHALYLPSWKKIIFIDTWGRKKITKTYLVVEGLENE